MAKPVKRNGGWWGNPYTPWQTPTTAPPGTYDPAFDAAQDNANLGFLFSSQDYTTQMGDGTNPGRLAEDYQTGISQLAGDLGISRAQAERQYGRSLSDLLRDRTRQNAAYDLSGQRMGEDYTRNVQGLERSYQRLGNQQAQQARQMGVEQGGALAQALRKRTENQAWDRQPIDTSYQRGQYDLNLARRYFNEDSSQAETRLNEDYYDPTIGQFALMQRGYDRGVGQLDTGYQRARNDATTQFTRQNTTNELYQRQIEGQKVYSAQQSGAFAPGSTYGPQAGENWQSKTPYIEERHGDTIWRRHPDGRMVPVRKAS